MIPGIRRVIFTTLAVVSIVLPVTGQFSLTTSFSSNTGQAGNMFDVLTTEDLVINDLDVNLDPGSWDVQVWGVSGGGSHQGVEQSPAAWTLLGSTFGLASNGSDTPTPLGLDLGLELAPGTTQGLYVTCTNGAGMNYTTTTAPVGTTWSADVNLAVRVGTGNVYPFGSAFSPRLWNGTVHYSPIIHVPDDFGTIQAAINAAADGNIVRVAPGTYGETIDFLGKAIIVESSGGPGVTIIDGGNSGSVVSFRNNEGLDSILRGIAVTGGLGLPGEAGGIHIDSAGPLIEQCVVANNIGGNGSVFGIANGGSGGIHGSFALATIRDCNVQGNVGGAASGSGRGGAGGIGGKANFEVERCFVALNIGGSSPGGGGGAGGIGYGSLAYLEMSFSGVVGNTGGNGVRGGAGGVQSIGDSGADILTCLIANNDGGSGTTDIGGGGGWFCENAGSILKNSIFTGNAGGSSPVRGGAGAISVLGDTGMSTINCTIHGNIGGGGATGPGGMLFYELIHSGASVTNTIIWSNTGLEILHVPQGGPNEEQPTVTYSNVQGGYVGTGNIDQDPQFVDPGAGDFHVLASSPCVDAGTSSIFSLPTSDFDGEPRSFGSAVDIGADEVVNPVLPGSGADLAIELLVNGSESVQTSTGDNLMVRLSSPGGSLNGNPLIVFAQLYPAGAPPVGLGGVGFPEIHVDLAGVVILFDGTQPGPFGPAILLPGGFTLGYQVSASPPGFIARVQGLVTTAQAPNGIFVASPAADVAFL